MPTLEEQALGPIQAAGEMNMPLDQLVARLSAIPRIQAVVRGGISGPGDQSQDTRRGDRDLRTHGRVRTRAVRRLDRRQEKAISEEAKRGFVLFNGKALCSACHEGWNFTNDGFQDIGLPSADVGRGEFLPGVIKMKHAFKTPGLREIGRRSPLHA